MHRYPVRLPLPDIAATNALAASLAPLLRTGDAILLEGPLGAGKSTFARALLRSASGDSRLEAPSPTFTLVQTYETARGRIHHFDLWRLPDARALIELGWDEARDDIVVVEWPDRLGALLPADALSLVFSLDDAADNARVASLAGWPGRLPNFGPEPIELILPS